MSDKESDPKNQEATDKANTVHKFKEAFNAAVFGPDRKPRFFGKPKMFILSVPLLLRRSSLP